jgi:hypothetical protein
MTCELEKRFQSFCLGNSIKVLPHDHESGLDFYLPDFDVYVEIKQFHSNRIAEQMSRRDNVIAIQGRKAMDCFEKMMKPQPV